MLMFISFLAPREGHWALYCNVARWRLSSLAQRLWASGVMQLALASVSARNLKFQITTFDIRHSTENDKGPPDMWDQMAWIKNGFWRFSHSPKCHAFSFGVADPLGQQVCPWAFASNGRQQWKMTR